MIEDGDFPMMDYEDDDLMKQAIEAGPMPGSKRLMKRPASAKANHSCHFYHMTIAKAKSYICFTTVEDKAKKLLFGCSLKQSKHHGDVITTIHKFLLEQPLTKEQAVSLRNDLIS